MYPNGYITVDCGGLDLTETDPQTINGLYEKVQGAIKSGKPIFACNCIWDGSKIVTPVQVFAIQYLDDTVICTASTLQVWVTDEDAVTIVNMIA